MSEFRILVQVQISLLKSKTVISQGTNYKFIFTDQFDLKHQNKDEVSMLVK